MFKIHSLLILSIFVFVNKTSAQKSDTILPLSNLCHSKSFTYRLIHQEYLQNENEYFLANTVDTSYLIFKNKGEPYVYEVSDFADEEGKRLKKDGDTTERMTKIIEFTPEGSVKMLRNWKVFRDIIISSYSAQVRLAAITASEFEEMKNSVNNENIVRRMVMEDINYIFSLNGDTFRTDVEYLRVKNVRSPYSGNSYYFEGNLKTERMEGTKNTVIFSAQNRAGKAEKPFIMEEAKKYQRKMTPKGEEVSEITAVGLNSEQMFQYNIAQKQMIKIILSDVASINFSARGNIRNYSLWDVVQP